MSFFYRIKQHCAALAPLLLLLISMCLTPPVCHAQGAGITHTSVGTFPIGSTSFGGVRVTILPTEVQSLAGWRITSPIKYSTQTFNRTGAQRMGLAPGTYGMTFLAVNGWLAPNDITFEIIADRLTDVVATYVRPSNGPLVKGPEIHATPTP